MTTQVLKAIESEREYQESKWPGHKHTAAEWILIMDKCMADAKRAWVCGHGNDQALHEIRQVVAVGVAAMEQCGAPGRANKEAYKPIMTLREIMESEHPSANDANNATDDCPPSVPCHKDLLISKELYEEAMKNPDNSKLVEAAAESILRLTKTLIEANEFCRMTYQVVARDGARTDWRGFEKSLNETLNRQHDVMYPLQKGKLAGEA